MTLEELRKRLEVEIENAQDNAREMSERNYHEEAEKYLGMMQAFALVLEWINDSDK